MLCVDGTEEVQLEWTCDQISDVLMMNLFELGSHDTFHVLLPPVGELTKVLVWHDGAGFGRWEDIVMAYMVMA